MINLNVFERINVEYTATLNRDKKYNVSDKPPPIHFESLHKHGAEIEILCDDVCAIIIDNGLANTFINNEEILKCDFGLIIRNKILLIELKKINTNRCRFNPKNNIGCFELNQFPILSREENPKPCQFCKAAKQLADTVSHLISNNISTEKDFIGLHLLSEEYGTVKISQWQLNCFMKKLLPQALENNNITKQLKNDFTEKIEIT